MTSPFGIGWWIRALLPAWPAWVVLVLTALSVPFTLMAAGAITATSGGVGAGLTLVSLLVIYPVCVGLFVAGLLAGDYLPRGLCFLASLVVLFASWVVFVAGIGLYQPELVLEGSIAIYGFSLIFLLPPTGFYLFASAGQIRQNREEARQRAFLDQADEVWSIRDIASALALSEDEVAPRLRRWSRDEVPGRIEQGLWIPDTQVEALQGSLLERIASEGNVRIEDAANALKLPIPLVEHWIYELVFQSRFQGYANWSEKRLISEDAGKLGDATQCPSCGSRLRAAGGGVARCESCGTERFLEAA